MTSKRKDDEATKTNKKRDGFFGDWLKRGDDVPAALMGYMTEAALGKVREALRDYSERTLDRWRNAPNGLPFTTAGHSSFNRVGP